MPTLNLESSGSQKITVIVASENLEIDDDNHVVAFTLNYKDGTSEHFGFHDPNKGHVIKQHFADFLEQLPKGTTALGGAGGRAYGKRLGTVGSVGGSLSGSVLGYLAGKILRDLGGSLANVRGGYFNDKGTLRFKGSVKI